jgi:hypothetical protein
MLGRTTIFLTVFLATAASAADQKILIPILYNSSQWVTFVSVLNQDAVRPFRSPGVQFFVSCAIPEGCQNRELAPGQIGGLYGINARGGLILLAPPELADKLVLRLSIRRAPVRTISGFTDLPVVRERDFRTSTITLLGVPLRDVFGDVPIRTRLRIYGPDGGDSSQVRVSLRNPVAPQGQPIEPRIVTLSIPPIETVGPPPPPLPAFAELDLATTFPIALQFGPSYNVDIEPVTPNLRFWAFVTVTDNATNEVTVITPQ